jgi:ABC-type glycerol-3-phosphate transport system substrate-binding protein
VAWAVAASRKRWAFIGIALLGGWLCAAGCGKSPQTGASAASESTINEIVIVSPREGDVLPQDKPVAIQGFIRLNPGVTVVGDQVFGRVSIEVRTPPGAVVMAAAEEIKTEVQARDENGTIPFTLDFEYIPTKKKEIGLEAWVDVADQSTKKILRFQLAK